MRITLSDGRTVQAIGDPHFGKKFEVGVPLDKRGQREATQVRDFRTQLNEDVDVVVVVGDVFEHPYVPYAAVDTVASALVDAVKVNPDTLYIVYAGNHDMPRDITKVGAFHDLVERLEGRYDNLILARRPMVVTDIAIFPWEWDRRADEQVQSLKGQKAIVAFGHWDLMSFDGKDDHLAPTKALQDAFGAIPIYTGHVHTPGTYKIAGVDVVCTGSLQPYSHGEDPDSTLYVTLTLEEAEKAQDLTSKNVRVLLKPGETLPVIDALSVIPKRVVEEKAEKVTVSLADFDWKKTLGEAIEKMTPEVQKFTLERMPHVVTPAQQRRGSDQTI